MLVNAIFEKASAAGANFTGAILEEAFFGHTALTGARFVDARLREADFSHASLTAADFTGASLYRTRFHGTNRDEAVLPKAAGWLGDDEERLAAETWQPRHGAAAPAGARPAPAAT